MAYNTQYGFYFVLEIIFNYLFLLNIFLKVRGILNQKKIAFIGLASLFAGAVYAQQPQLIDVSFVKYRILSQGPSADGKDQNTYVISTNPKAAFLIWSAGPETVKIIASGSISRCRLLSEESRTALEKNAAYLAPKLAELDMATKLGQRLDDAGAKTLEGGKNYLAFLNDSEGMATYICDPLKKLIN